MVALVAVGIKTNGLMEWLLLCSIHSRNMQDAYTVVEVVKTEVMDDAVW